MYLILTAATLAAALVVLGLFHKELLLLSFDRAMAVTLRKKVIFWDVLLYLLIGLTVSMAVLSVGPLISFGFLLGVIYGSSFVVWKLIVRWGLLKPKAAANG